MTTEESSSLPKTSHNEVTLSLAKKESAEHIGKEMEEVYATMRNKKLVVRAVPIDQEESSGIKLDSKKSTVVKTVYFIRHGQGFHNFCADMFSADGKEWEQFVRSPTNPYTMSEVLDAPLTEKGRLQAHQLNSVTSAWPAEKQPELVVLSPNCRALQTGLIVFGHLLSKESNVKFVAHEMVRETHGVHLCDKRRSVTRAKVEFSNVDFSLITDDEDMLFEDDRRESKMEIGSRVYKFFEWLHTKEENIIAVASHSGWLMSVFNGVCDCHGFPELREWFHTGEMRSVKLIFEEQ